MTDETPQFTVEFAKTDQDFQDALRLRYDVFVQEFGSTGAGVDHRARIERDAFDQHAMHLLLKDRGRVVGVYRLLNREGAQAAGRFYSESEFDLLPLLSSGRRLLELGRSCLHPDYRGGQGMLLLWSALADYVMETGTEVLFGTASFQGTNLEAVLPSLSLLHEKHLAPEEICPIAHGATAILPEDLKCDDLDRRAAMLAVPPLIKSYLRLGGFVGKGAFLDREFQTIDVLLVLDVARMSESQRTSFTKRSRS